MYRILYCAVVPNDLTDFGMIYQDFPTEKDARNYIVDEIVPQLGASYTDGDESLVDLYDSKLDEYNDGHDDIIEVTEYFNDDLIATNLYKVVKISND